MKRPNIMGIDPGKSGGICLIKSNGEVNLGTMPENEIKTIEYFQHIKSQGGALVFLEQVWTRLDDLSAGGKVFGIQKMMKNFNILTTCLSIVPLPYILVPPQAWQGYLSKCGVKKKQYRNPKNAFKAFAIQQFPKKLTQINLKTADAACIAWYGSKVLISRPKETLNRIQNPAAMDIFSNLPE